MSLITSDIYRPYARQIKSQDPNDRQKIFHGIVPYNAKIVKGAIGGLGGGKSTACEEEQAMICMKTPGGKSFAGRMSMGRSDVSVIEDYRKIVAGYARWEAAKKWFRFDNGHLLMIAPADEWDRFGSVELVSFYLQEAQEIEYNIFDALNQRLRHPSGEQNGIPYYRGYFDARGVKKEHWIWKKFALKAWNVDFPEEHGPECRAPNFCRAHVENPDFVYVKFTTYDNTQNLREGYLEEQLRDHKDDLAWKKMLIDGEFGFDIEGRPVYECYRPEIHDAEIGEDATLPILRGWDFGYNKPAVIWCQYTRDGRLLVLRELVPTGVSRDELCRMVEAEQRSAFPNRHTTQYRDFGDIAGEQPNTTGVTDVEFVESYFRTTVESRKARVNDGHEVIRKLMTSATGKQKQRFSVDYQCERLREALAGAYYYRMDKTEERPVKGTGYDDVADALRFVAQLIVEESPGATPTSWSTAGKSSFASY